MATTKLKLYRERAVVQAAVSDEIPATFRFPAIPRGRGERGQSQRQTLVAGRVEREEADGGPDRAPSLRLTSDDGTVRTPELVRQIEQTLEAMQARVDRLRKQADEPFRFPVERDDHDHRPTAA